jgi:hypothetical protein
MSARRKSDVALAALNLTLLATTALALVTTCAWSVSAPRVDEFGRTLWDSHVRVPGNRLKVAIADLEQGRDESGVRAIETLLIDLEETRPGDRLAPIKAGAYRALATHDANANRLEHAVDWLDQWLSFDERNLDVQVERATLLQRIPERSGEAERTLSALHERFPEAASVQRAYSEMTPGETDEEQNP